MNWIKYFSLFLFITLSCARGGQPCPTLSKSEGEGQHALIKRNATTSKKGLIEKKGVKKVKRR